MSGFNDLGPSTEEVKKEAELQLAEDLIKNFMKYTTHNRAQAKEFTVKYLQRVIDRIKDGETRV